MVGNEADDGNKEPKHTSLMIIPNSGVAGRSLYQVEVMTRPSSHNGCDDGNERNAWTELLGFCFVFFFVSWFLLHN